MLVRVCNPHIQNNIKTFDFTSKQLHFTITFLKYIRKIVIYREIDYVADI